MLWKIFQKKFLRKKNNFQYMQVKINNTIFEATDGETILDVCRRNGIKIPTLCNMKDVHEGVCRLCMVESGGRLITSCNTKVCPELDIATESEKVTRARRTNLELLWADHAGKCGTCKKNRRCELQNTAIEHKLDVFHFVPKKEEMTSREELDLLKDNRTRIVVDEANAAISRTTELCVKCRRCIHVCPTKEFSFNYRSADVVVGTAYEKPLDCIFCGQCVKHCPTGAITDKNDLAAIVAELDDPKKMAIALFDPALLESMSLEQPEIGTERQMIGALKAVGFEAVFDLSFGMELFLDEAAEKIRKDRKNSIILSHCPSLNLYVEKYFPQLISNILDVPTPDDLMADFIKKEYARKNKIDPKDIIIVSVSSCVAKKIKKNMNLDHVITMREAGRIFRQKNLKLAEIAGAEFDRGLLPKNKEAKRMAKCGGAAELIAKNIGCGYVVADGVEEIKNILSGLDKKRVEAKIIEMMVCPGGCVNGGGQSNKIL
jgi:iron only hydrogenase large subunit-like protein